MTSVATHATPRRAARGSLPYAALAASVALAACDGAAPPEPTTAATPAAVAGVPNTPGIVLRPDIAAPTLLPRADGAAPPLPGHVAPPVAAGGGSAAARAADVTASVAVGGSPGLLWHQTGTGNLGVWSWQSGVPGALPGAWHAYAISGGWEVRAVADFNGDGMADWILRQPGTSNFGVYLAPPASGWTAFTASADWEIADAADFNGDGTPDLLWRGPAGGASGLGGIWLMTGTTPRPAATGWTTLGVSAGWHADAAADFTFDGKPDVLWHQTGTGNFGVWAMNGTTPGALPGAWGALAVSPGWEVTDAADLDGSGTPDLLFRNDATGAYGVWRMSGVVLVPAGAGGWVPVAGSGGWHVDAAGDFGGTTTAPLRVTIQAVRAYDPTSGSFYVADLSSVSRTLYVTLNLDQGSYRADSVRLRIGTHAQLCQSFSGVAPSDPEGGQPAGAPDFQALECQINTAQFDTLTGAVRVPNGAQSLAAEVFYRPIGAAPGTQLQQAAATLPLTTNNASGFYTRVTSALPPGDPRLTANIFGRALGPDGRTWLTGDLRVQLVPVLFAAAGAAGPLQAVSVTLTDPNLPGGSVSQIAPAAGNVGPVTVAFAGGSADVPQGGGTLTGFTSTPTGSVVTLGATGGNAGNAFLGAAGVPIAGPFTVNVDNQRPEPRAITIPSQFTQGNVGNVGFVSGGFAFADSLTVSAATTTYGDFGGVNRVSFTYYVGANDGGSDAQLVATGTRARTGADLAPAYTNTAYRAVAVIMDALGNSRTTPVLNTTGSANFTFGVDLVPPMITTSPSSTVTRRGGAFSSNLTYVFSIADDVSGFNTLPLVARIVRNSPADGPRCVTSVTTDGGQSLVDAASATVPMPTTSPCPLLPISGFFGVATSAPRGEYEFAVAARDVAGNVSPFQTRRVVIDPAPPTVGGMAIPGNLGGNVAATFVASVIDDFDLVSGYGLVAYGNSGVTLRLDGPTLGNSFDAVFTTSAPVVITATNGFIRAVTMSATTNSGGTLGSVGATSATRFPTGAPPYYATQFGVVAIDAGNNRAFNQITIPAGNLGGTPPSIAGGTPTGIDSLRVQLLDPSGTPSGTLASVGGVTMLTDTLSTSGFGYPANPLYVTVRLDVFATTDASWMTFQRAELWTIAPNTLFGGNAAATGAVYNPAQPLSTPFTATAYRFFQGLGAPLSVSINGRTRTTRYTAPVWGTSLDPGVNGTATAQFVVVGVTYDGDAIVSAPFQLVVNNP